MSKENLAELKEKLAAAQGELEKLQAKMDKKLGKPVETNVRLKVTGILLGISIFIGVIGGLTLWASVTDATVLFIGIMLLAIAVSSAVFTIQLDWYYDKPEMPTRIRPWAVVTGTFIAVTGLGMVIIYWTTNLPLAIIGFCVTMIGGFTEELARNIKESPRAFTQKLT